MSRPTFPTTTCLRALAVPTLIVNGGNSEPAMQQVGALLAERLPSAQHVELAGEAHQLHRPEAVFNELLETFLASNSSGFQPRVSPPAR